VRGVLKCLETFLRGGLGLFFPVKVSDAETATASADVGRGGLCDPFGRSSSSSAIMPCSSLAMIGIESSSRNEDDVGDEGGVPGWPEAGLVAGAGAKVSGSIGVDRGKPGRVAQEEKRVWAPPLFITYRRSNELASSYVLCSLYSHSHLSLLSSHV
jgi:hypothetical protein